MAFPLDVGLGTVVGEFLGIDGEPLAGGVVTFKPSASRLLVVTDPTTILPGVVVGSTNAAGVLLGPSATPGVELVATDNDIISPQGWTWNVSVSFGKTQNGPQPYQFSFALPTGGEVDLATLTPVAASNGTPIITGPAGPPGGAAPASTVDLAAIVEGA